MIAGEFHISTLVAKSGGGNNSIVDGKCAGMGSAIPRFDVY